DEDELEPPVPAGLAELSGPLRSLAGFLRLEEELLEAAAEASPPLAEAVPSTAALTKWVRQLPPADKDDVIVRLLRGDGAHLRAELLRRYRGGTATEAVDGRRRGGERLTAGGGRWADRQRPAGERKAAEEARREAEIVAARERRLDQLAV